jgi:predicted P-loop ATPase
MCPPELANYIAEDISNDKDARILLAKNFLVNLDELAVLSKKDINQLKSYFSKTIINERLPYDRKNSILPRVCSFIGSTNMATFLNDETGSVRWLCFELTQPINFAYKKEIDINKVWEQAYALSKTNFDCELSFKDVQDNEKRNSKYTTLSAEQEIISKYFKIPVDEMDVQFMTSSDVLHYLSIKYQRLNHVNIGKAMTGLGFERTKDRERQVYGYMVKTLPLFPIN